MRLTELAGRKAAFTSPFELLRPFILSLGLQNALIYFLKLMYNVQGCIEGFALPYLDDVAIFSAKWSEHMS